VLVDDVIASGSHLRAAAAFLESQGATIVKAIYAARADDSPVVEDAFAIRTITLESLAVCRTERPRTSQTAVRRSRGDRASVTAQVRSGIATAARQ